MNRTYLDFDRISNTNTTINIKSDGFDATLTITYEDLSSGMVKTHIYHGTRVCFHHLVKTCLYLYERGRRAEISLWNHAFNDLLSTEYSDAEVKYLMDDYEVNDPIDLIDILLKEGAFKTLRCAFKMN